MSAESAATDADDICKHQARQKEQAGWRLISALGISVMLHAGLVAVRGGELTFPGAHYDATERKANGAPAPLRVRLSARKLRLGHSAASDDFRISPPPDQAPVVMTDMHGEGGATTEDNPAAERPQPQPRIGAPAPVYFSVTEVSRRPEPLAEIDPNPPGLENQSGSGKVVLDLYIGESGRMDRVDVESTTTGDALAAGIAEEFRQMRFQPAEIDGTPVKSRLRVEVLVRPLMRP